MSFWDDWGNVIIGLGGLGTTVAALNKDIIANKITRNQDKRDASNTAVSASEQAVNIMQDVLESINQARQADRDREDACHRALEQERKERKEEYERLNDIVSRMENSVELYRKRVHELESKFGV